jgi:hypothetical protein
MCCAKEMLHRCHLASVKHKDTQAAALLTPKAPSSILEYDVPTYTVVTFSSRLQKSMAFTYYNHIYLTFWAAHQKTPLLYL